MSYLCCLTVDTLSDTSVISTRARELPDHCPSPLLEHFTNKFVDTWEIPADALLNEIFGTLGAHLDKITSQHFPEDTYPTLYRKVK